MLSTPHRLCVAIMRGLVGFRGQKLVRTGTRPEPGASRDRSGSGEARAEAGAHTSVSPQILAALPMDWRGTHLLACSCLRVVFIPLFILCVYPSGTPALRHPAWPCVLSLLMGISNGYFGSVPMILAAGKVGPKQRELAGKGNHQAGKPRPVEVKATPQAAAFGPRGGSAGSVQAGVFVSPLPPSSHDGLASRCHELQAHSDNRSAPCADGVDRPEPTGHRKACCAGGRYK